MTKTPKASDAAQPAAASVAVVDLDEVAKRTGRSEKLNVAIKEREIVLNREFEAGRAAMESQIAAKVTEFGDAPSDEQKAQLQAMRQESTRQLLMAQQQANNQLTQLRSELIGEFRSEIQPVVQRVAAEKQISLVLTKNDTVVLTFDPLIDITETIADRLTPLSGKATNSASSTTPQESEKQSAGNAPESAPLVEQAVSEE